MADEALDRAIGRLLQIGIATATTLGAIGGMVFLARHGREPAAYGSFQGAPENLRTIGGVLAAVATGRGRGVIQLGLLLLIATPVARVALTLVAFARARDRQYVLISGVVLALLLLSLFGLSS